MSQQRIAFKVHGNVQGVNFRSWTQQKANSYNITGWVKNTNDDKVIGEAQGSSDALQKFKKDLNEGPKPAHVVKVEANDIEAKSGENSFSAT